jgi:hypothetical protein
MCRDTFWLSHEVMLADPNALSDVTAAIEKIAANADELGTKQAK